MDSQFVTIAFAWVCALIAAAITGEAELEPQTCKFRTTANYFVFDF